MEAKKQQEYNDKEINNAGKILRNTYNHSEEDNKWADEVLTQFRSRHTQALIYFNNSITKLLEAKKHRLSKGILIQRLKRRESIEAKLNNIYKLSKIQDIGGLRVILKDMEGVETMRKVLSNKKWQHKEKKQNDYIKTPKTDGYRSFHLVYEYIQQDKSPVNIEIQIRTTLQHIWATAVESMGVILGQRLKSGEGDEEIRDFFAFASSGFALIEECNVLEAHKNMDKNAIYGNIIEKYNRLNIKQKLESFSYTDKMPKPSASDYYYLIESNYSEIHMMSSVNIKRYKKKQQEEANNAYTNAEKNRADGQQVVLVSAKDIIKLKKAFPNYFFDTQEFIKKMEKIRQNIITIID
jgi:putative GTP pyrophosphokinase